VSTGFLEVSQPATIDEIKRAIKVAETTDDDLLPNQKCIIFSLNRNNRTGRSFIGQ
jgi:hypothetical protein